MTTKNLSFEEVRKMRKGATAFEVKNFPFIDDVQIGIRVLSQAEIIQSQADGRLQANKNISNPTEQEIMDFATRELLYRAVIRVPEKEVDKYAKYSQFFESSEEVGELSVDEIVMLLEYYNETQEKYAPVQRLETAEDFESLIGELKKKSVLGNSLSTYTLRKLLQYMVNLSQGSPSDNGTGSTPANPSESKTNETSLPEVGIKIESLPNP